MDHPENIGPTIDATSHITTKRGSQVRRAMHLKYDFDSTVAAPGYLNSFSYPSSQDTDLRRGRSL
jgi:hypothetical protein